MKIEITVEGYGTPTPAELLRDLAICIKEATDEQLNRKPSQNWSSEIADRIRIEIKEE